MSGLFEEIAKGMAKQLLPTALINLERFVVERNKNREREIREREIRESRSIVQETARKEAIEAIKKQGRGTGYYSAIIEITDNGKITHNQTFFLPTTYFAQEMVYYKVEIYLSKYNRWIWDFYYDTTKSSTLINDYMKLASYSSLVISHFEETQDKSSSVKSFLKRSRLNSLEPSELLTHIQHKLP
ncbi:MULTISPECIES: hypothetical protein [unclassified Tolypothrix]|uniref:hypothetical protein n=1 Tax=unclassified Tolypothrix TaxID=2649714 RepID=UPI0005EABFFE|nr:MULTISPECIES: hypothetical protein [unclassified Tolypothrix]BAY90774.1 hypothetical protein NIES3275_27910 [Microchaete diplosiphon NIES-3275]EKF04384.1 hypothetical protein FDUTEX481_02063 [Tolypothrix sp. PCC 7601]MBE9081027.1 hypothetical protein [Tolypothrix sp. LEGE 11397]UYD24907.1 hypothetical protein HGR01_26340 [Tolypothrix sp. PCC 7712]UYD32860.1 hypothetical protein HG267_28295 [Tolypothrix sp. PCC 7601]